MRKNFLFFDVDKVFKVLKLYLIVFFDFEKEK